MIRHNEDMYKMYESYKNTLKNARKTVTKRQKLNAEIREKYPNPYKREDYQKNKSDISAWNSMIGELEEDIKLIEMYLDYDDREYLHRECENIRRLIFNKNSYEGEIPMGDLYSASVPDATDIVCDVELQEEIVELLDEVLTDRQKQVMQMYFWEGKTMGKIASELGIIKQAVDLYLKNAIKKLQESIKNDKNIEFYNNI